MVGTKWFKCDLHLHTPASKCFRDQTITAEQWMQEVINKGLDCVAVTDHNTGEWIDQIKQAALGKNVTVFPGVELTCSDAKVHLLIVFDPEKTRQDIEDFILLTRIDRASFGEQEAHSPMSVDDVVSLAVEKGAICIPAHIDEYNGISQVATAQRKKLLEEDKILGVQVVHHCLTVPESSYNAASKAAALKTVNGYFGVSEEDIDANRLKISEDRLKDWRQAVVQSMKANKAILTFSDNPHASGDSRHGLWGIGSRHTWIKMDQAPSLESLRQALLLHKFRIKSDFDCPGNDKPYNTPQVWLQKVTIKNSEISHPTNILEVEFSPQMNTIIGGRGSGKSAILQFIRGLFNRQGELSALPLVQQEFDRFFRIKGKNDRYGVLKPLCEIEVEVVRLDELYRVKMVQVNANSRSTEVFKFNTDTANFDKIDNTFLSFFDFDIFSQKQIYEVATNLNSLRERIDEADDGIKALKGELELKDKEFKQKSSEIRTLALQVEGKALLQAEILDIESRIQKYHASGIDVELKKRQTFQKDEGIITRFETAINSKAVEFDNLANSISIPKINLDDFSADYRTILTQVVSEANLGIQRIKESILVLKDSYLKVPQSFNTSVNATQWKSDNDTSKMEFEQKKQALSEAGISAVEQIQSDVDLLQRKKNELEQLELIEQQIVRKKAEKAELKQTYVSKRLDLTTLRRQFLENLLRNTNVRAKIEGCRDIDNLEDQIREILNSYGTFSDDIPKLTQYWNASNPQRSNEGIFKIITEIANDQYTGGDFYRPFMTKIKQVNGEQIDDFDLLFPEDHIKIEYKNGAGQWKQLSNASAGQKTAAILTMILCYGSKPLILDQPEDDLDNNLIYELVVEQLRKTKECRQIICVTHNANIPVNGDSEHIIVMDSETKYIQSKYIGSIEDEEIKKAICDIMEGGTEAFEMRSKRYQRIRN